MLKITDILIQLGLVIVVGGLIGAEREHRSKSAGFRTMILICLGSYLFTLFSRFISPNTPDRIASTIVTGIGFLGAGVIYRSENRINGITTAATIWVTAALGVGIAAQYYILVLVCTGFILIALLYLTRLEKIIDRSNQTRNYRIVCPCDEAMHHKYEKLFSENNLDFQRLQQIKTGDSFIGNWLVHGSEKNHERFIAVVLNDAHVKEFEF